MKLIFEGIKPEAGTAATFIFQPSEPLHWTAGQSIKIAVPGEWGPLEHRFTIAASPTEGKVAITTRPSGSDYKQALFALVPGDQVDAFAIDGSFVWRDTPLTPVFVAAGIGITPFRAILHDRAVRQLPINATLLYGTPADAIIFKGELDGWASANPGFKVRYFTDRRVNVAHIAQQANLAQSLVYVSGPSAMVDELSAGLMAAGLPNDQLMRDWFIGRLPEAG